MKIIPALLILLYSCNQKQMDLSEQAKQEIIQADREMSSHAVKEGFYKTLLTYSDEDVVKPQEGEFPVIGKGNLEKHWSGKNDTRAISWEPFKAEASKSGDMGYTLGNWKMKTNDSTFYGNYYTIWKKQSDGKWKFVFDGGNGTPALEDQNSK